MTIRLKIKLEVNGLYQKAEKFYYRLLYFLEKVQLTIAATLNNK